MGFLDSTFQSFREYPADKMVFPFELNPRACTFFFSTGHLLQIQEDNEIKRRKGKGKEETGKGKGKRGNGKGKREKRKREREKGKRKRGVKEKRFTWFPFPF
jgi:hypothetical protein